MSRLLLSLSVLLALCQTASASMRFASPLQALTVWDNAEPVSPRDKYLQKYKAGLEAENKVREELKKKHTEFLTKQDTASPEWAKRAVRYERVRKVREERLVEKAYDEAVKRVDAEQSQKETDASTQHSNKYQYVGVVSKDEGKAPITWYARAKPAKANWSLRLVHVNKDAIIKDLYNQGKVDVFAKYKNEGFKTITTEEDGAAPDQVQKELSVKGQYAVRERSWRTGWNFSPKHFFTDSAGMYWRERRLPPGLYTDGTTVYETSYRYKDGRNGMRRVRTLNQFMQDTTVKKGAKDKLLKRIQKDHPDIVVEG